MKPNDLVIVTGAGSGIGAALARRAAALGMRVIATDVDSKGLAAFDNPLITTQRLDVTQADQVEAFSAQVFEQYGKVNYLFNNAGVLVDAKSWELSEKDWRWCLDVNIMGVVNCIRSFVPRMLKQQQPGLIINTSSVGGLIGGGAFIGAYQATKHAIVALTETLFQELLLEGDLIKAAVLCPGAVDTGIWESDRLRAPHEQTVRESQSAQKFHHFASTNSKTAITPDEFAEKAFDAIATGKFWLLPQPDFKPMYRLRADSVLDETNPVGLRHMPKS